MKVNEFLDTIRECESYGRLQSGREQTVRLSGVSGSLFSVVMTIDWIERGGVVVAVMEDRDSASYLYNDIYNILEGLELQHRVLLMPTAYRRAITSERVDPSGIVQRTSALEALQGDEPLIICSWSDALAEKVVSDVELRQKRLELSVGQSITMDDLESAVEDFGFRRVEFVVAPGEFAIRGGIIDIFSYSASKPYRLDFLGDELDSIRTFTPSTQLSDSDRTTITIVPNLRTGEIAKEQRLAFTDFAARVRDVSSLTLWFSQGEESLKGFDALRAKYRGEDIDTQLCSTEELRDSICGWRVVTKNSDLAHRTSDITIDFGATPQPSFSGNFELFAKDVVRNYSNGILSYLVTPNVEQRERVERIFSEIAIGDSRPTLLSIALTLKEGFVMPSTNVALYTDHQLFERYLRYRVRGEIDKAEGMTLSEFSALRVGDYVVHIDHGIGKFSGLVRQREKDNSDVVREFIKLTYRDGDVLFVGVQNLHRISKYKSGDSIGDGPVLQKLGSSAWSKLKQATKRKVKDIARELIRLYAQRKMSRGFAFSEDSYLQQELEASFIYEDTPDQRATTEAVKTDMESTMPMDRLVCGDVGFGKTEIAIRAAFKAVSDSKQVAVLVPTTVLSLQHFRTFSRRLKGFPARIENFSRSNTAAKTKEIVADLENGKIDIIIGTHKLLGKGVRFKDLGLLIVDEEQKFGVSVKEKLRELKHSVDTLTLTATPIPRTLQFSLMGARDMSIINTPPPNRRPVSTELHTYNDEIIREAIEYELSRGGQVFFVHNRVQTIGKVAALVERLVPGARVGIGHGQMPPKELEQVMMDFIYGEYNVLVATTIIESGIDIPNANTIIINHANHFGLSDLHQLRGRVGRTNRKAFCYLLVPSMEAITADAQRRLRAIEEFSDLGSGFNIAMQDLDIRGAGNILGAEQSGFMADIGYETYQRIVAEAMGELYEEMKDEIGDDLSPAVVERLGVMDCTVELDTSAHLPDNYIGSTSEKLKLYRELDKINSIEALDEFIVRLKDRFGEPPKEAQELFEVVLLRGDAARLGFDRVVIKGTTATLTFAHDAQSSYYSGETFNKIMGHIIMHPKDFKLKEGGRLSLLVNGVRSVEYLRKLLMF